MEQHLRWRVKHLAALRATFHRARGVDLVRGLINQLSGVSTVAISALTSRIHLRCRRKNPCSLAGVASNLRRTAPSETIFTRQRNVKTLRLKLGGPRSTHLGGLVRRAVFSRTRWRSGAAVVGLSGLLFAGFSVAALPANAASADPADASQDTAAQ